MARARVRFTLGIVGKLVEPSDMNVVFLSPAFPPTAPDFCEALRNRGVKVLGIGDAPLEAAGALPSALFEYVFEPQMHHYEVLRNVVAGLQARHGAIHRIDSNGEHWLEAEARLRDDFGVPGLSLAQVEKMRSKLGMAEIFAAAGIEHPPGIRADSQDAVRAFATEHGFPIVLKPDRGSGAADTFTLGNAIELEHALQRPLAGFIVQPFVEGRIITFDGLTDGGGRVLFCTSHVYDAGIMQVRLGQLDGHYYSLRDLPVGLEQIGRLAVAAFDVRERFFHVEFFAQPDGRFIALEMNLRPPGGFTTDMMNAACGFDVYGLWADALLGRSVPNFEYQRNYHTAHVGRRNGRSYRLTHEQLVLELGATLVTVRSLPEVFSVTMGNVMYLLRHTDLEALRRAIALVQAPA